MSAQERFDLWLGAVRRGITSERDRLNQMNYAKQDADCPVEPGYQRRYDQLGTIEEQIQQFLRAS